MQILTQTNKYLIFFSIVFLCAIGLAVLLEDYLIFIVISYIGSMFVIIWIVQKDYINLTNQLAKTRQKLIQIEKIAVLGKEMASITHEINTPLSVISSATTNIRIFFEQLPTMFKLSYNKSDFITLLKLSSHNLLSSREERKHRRKIAKQLIEIENSETIASYLVSMGIYDNVEDLLPLLQSPDSIEVIEMAYKISIFQKNVLNISIAIDKAIKIVTAINTYANTTKQKVATNIIDGIETTLMLYHNKTKIGVEIVRDYTELPTIMGHPDQLCQVWANLIHNALQSMEYKGKLQIETKLQNSCVCVNIYDDGNGIPADIQTKIFDPFFTTKSTGNGLGLDIVKSIITKHNGEITVTSKPGRTLFSVLIPIL
ncbi:MAG: GHKL domain-containing protein [Candidatus Marithrix sp.]|nr:GHKL domain-containing protein [Candidatus Marithrix sp.]